eukprot:jgi/Galph1/1308/GphlegSOOS_G6045.1
MSSLEQEDQVALVSRSLTCSEYSLYLCAHKQENQEVLHSCCQKCASSNSGDIFNSVQRPCGVTQQSNWFRCHSDGQDISLNENSCIKWSLRSLSFSCASVCGINHRLSGQANQDRFSSLFIPPLSYAFGVFDGHGIFGADAAEITANCLLPYLGERLQSGSPPKAALEAAFKHAATVLEASPCAVSSGTTATVVLITEEEIYVSNVGDSGVVLGSQIPFYNNATDRKETESGVSADSVEEHKETKRTDNSNVSFYWQGSLISSAHRLESFEERRRVQTSGAFVDGEYIVNRYEKGGALNLTRTLGDLDMRDCGIVSEPSTNRVVLSPFDKFLIIASDGLWDSHDRKLTAQDIVEFVANNLCGTQDACRQLIQLAEEDGPFDDCTIIFALLS